MAKNLGLALRERNLLGVVRKVGPEIAKEVLKGRAEFMSQFPSLRSPEAQAKLPDPGNPATFESCKLDFSERDKHGEAYRLHKDLLRIRRTDPVLSAQTPGGVDGALLGDRTFVLRFAGASGEDRLLLVNLMADLHIAACSEPLMAPPASASDAPIDKSKPPDMSSTVMPTAAIAAPVAVPPVNETAFTSGWPVSAGPTFGPAPWTMLSTPAGSPAALAMRASSAARAAISESTWSVSRASGMRARAK